MRPKHLPFWLLIGNCHFYTIYTLRNSWWNKEGHHTIRNEACLNSFIKLRLRC